MSSGAARWFEDIVEKQKARVSGPFLVSGRLSISPDASEELLKDHAVAYSLIGNLPVGKNIGAEQVALTVRVICPHNPPQPSCMWR